MYHENVCRAINDLLNYKMQEKISPVTFYYNYNNYKIKAPKEVNNMTYFTALIKGDGAQLLPNKL